MDNNNNKDLTFSIIIPIRNEEKHLLNLLESIKNIDYPHYELIVINDNSTDKSLRILEDFQKNWPFKIINLESNLSSPKKMAIQKAIQNASGEYIFCTDGDCLIPPQILQKYAYQFKFKKKLFLAGPVTFFEKSASFWKTVWNKIQIVEFASLTGLGAVAMQLQRPNMCSGANLSFKKSVFFEVDGYNGNLHLASGDDEFLMQKIAQKYPQEVVYIKNQACIVETASADKLSDFFEQRKRWASKWKSYDNYVPTILAVFIFIINLLSIYLEINLSFKWLAIRYLVEAFLIGNVLIFLRKKEALWYILLVQVVYKYYVVYTAIRVLFGNKIYNWKGRQLK